MRQCDRLLQSGIICFELQKYDIRINNRFFLNSYFIGRHCHVGTGIDRNNIIASTFINKDRGSSGLRFFRLINYTFINLRRIHKVDRIITKVICTYFCYEINISIGKACCQRLVTTFSPGENIKLLARSDSPIVGSLGK